MGLADTSAARPGNGYRSATHPADPQPLPHNESAAHKPSQHPHSCRKTPLSRLESRNVLKAHIDNELWRYVFESLRNLRDVLADTSGKLRTRGPHDVSATLQFMVRAISAYLEEHDASYVRYMSSHGGWEPGWAHVEREWITAMRGRPAEDLLALREAIDKAVANLNEYAEDGREIEWGEPWAGEYWASWARGRDG
jgi:hypothetical protein